MIIDPIADATRIVRIQNTIALTALVSMVVVPAYGFQWLNRRRNGQAVLGDWWRALGGVGLVVYFFAGLVFTGCGLYQIGGSGEWKLSQAYGEPVSAALAQYHDRHGAYPESLAMLAPEFVSRETLTAPESSSLNSAFEYVRDSAGYTLKLHAGTPGWNECVHRPGKPWRCSGYF